MILEKLAFWAIGQTSNIPDVKLFVAGAKKTERFQCLPSSHIDKSLTKAHLLIASDVEKWLDKSSGDIALRNLCDSIMADHKAMINELSYNQKKFETLA